MKGKATFIESLYVPVQGLCYIARDRTSGEERMTIYVRPHDNNPDCENHILELVTERTEIIAQRTGGKDEYPIFCFQS